MSREHFGKKATDRITGVTGTITAHSSYITGCDQLLVQPKAKGEDKDFVEGRWFDINRLEIEDEVTVEIPTDEEQGCDQSAPVK